MDRNEDLKIGQVYDVSVEGVNWVEKGVFLGIRKYSPRSPRGYLVVYRAPGGEPILKGFTKFTFRRDILIMKHVYSPRASRKMNRYLEERLKKAEL
jgi:hypothetical protein